MRWIAVVGALSLVSSAWVASAHAGMCGSVNFNAHVLTVAGTAIPGDGGVLVGATGEVVGHAGATTDGKQASWRFRDVGKGFEPTMTAIAPGLVLYQAPGASSSEITLTNGKKDLVTVKRIADKPPAKLGAPSIKRVRHVMTPGHGNYNATVVIYVDLAKDPPAGALALVAFGNGKPRSWAAADQLDEHSLAVFRSPGKCQGEAPGTTESKVGDKVTFAWVDATGRLSKASGSLTVIKGKPL